MSKHASWGPMVAWAVIKGAGGHVAYRVDVDENNRTTRTALCPPVAESTAYIYLQAKMNEHLVQSMVQSARATGPARQVADKDNRK